MGANISTLTSRNASTLLTFPRKMANMNAGLTKRFAEVVRDAGISNLAGLVMSESAATLLASYARKMGCVSRMLTANVSEAIPVTFRHC